MGEKRDFEDRRRRQEVGEKKKFGLRLCRNPPEKATHPCQSGSVSTGRCWPWHPRTPTVPSLPQKFGEALLPLFALRGDESLRAALASTGLGLAWTGAQPVPAFLLEVPYFLR